MSRALFFLCTALFLVGSAFGQPASDSDLSPTNVILLIPDGYGPASATLARDYLRWRDGIRNLALDSLQTGSVRTFPAGGRVTDSAAGATAYSTGTKTYNGRIAMDTTGQQLGTLLEGAEQKNMVTGLVATSRITHATPASFSAHVVDRGEENEIAAQQLTKDIEVLMGGGRRHFLPRYRDGSARSDTQNLLENAQAQGYQIVDTQDELLAVDSPPVLGLFASSHMDYEIDRGPSQPSLSTMTQTALNLLGDAENGFFLMVEGSRIDHAGHANDATAHLHDILAFNEAVETALEYARADGNTLVVSVADHETGGLSLGRNVDGQGVYGWEPAVLDRVSASHDVVLDSTVQALTMLSDKASRDTIVETVTPIMEYFTGISELTYAERYRLWENAYDISADNYLLSDIISDIIGRRATIGWTTNGHTAVDVTLHAYGPGSSRFAGNHDNTYVGKALADLLEIDLGHLTEELRAEVVQE